MATLKDADIIIDALQSAGAKRCHGVVGDTLNQITDAIRRRGMEWVQVRHEEAGAFAAGADAYMTEQLESVQAAQASLDSPAQQEA